MDLAALEVIGKAGPAVQLIFKDRVVTFFPSEGALKTVRAGFNPSQIGAVDCLKLLGAAFIDQAVLAGQMKNDNRSAAVARTKMEEAAMWAVKAATATEPPGPQLPNAPTVTKFETSP